MDSVSHRSYPPRGDAQPTAAPDRLAVPERRADREQLARMVAEFARECDLVAPISLDALTGYAGRIAVRAGPLGRYRAFLMVLLNNEVWTRVVSAVPFSRRTLLLPPCLRDAGQCRAEFDDLGLICEQCGSCMIGDVSAEAERLGYAVLVAEGTGVVTSLIEKGMVDAVIGVSCMVSLERAFPAMAADAVPGIAIPLLRDGCLNTSVDREWLERTLRLSGDPADHTRVDVDRLRAEVRGWFEADALQDLLRPGVSETESIAMSWLSGAGKRWRPFLVAATYSALAGVSSEPLPRAVRQVAVAVECFHKASLVHDDIEDDDHWRYGKATLHRAHGVPVALNTGDFLLGEGYRLLSEVDLPPGERADMLRTAARQHRNLCLGQGNELSWMRRPAPLTPGQVLDIFRLKTAPAFEVALDVGAVAAGAGPDVRAALAAYSEALGIAYQVRDDLEDFEADSGCDDLWSRRPSLLLALAGAELSADGAAAADGPSHAQWTGDTVPEEVRRLVRDNGCAEKAQALLDEYRGIAVRAAEPIRNTALKTLLYRVLGRILGSGKPAGAGREDPDA